VIGGRIAAVGSDADIQPYIGPSTRLVRLGGRSVTPGLVDGHAHLYGLGVALESISLRGLTSEAAAVERIEKAAASRSSGEWVTGRGWDQNLWDPPQFPGRALLDAAVPDHPVVVRRIDGHAAWVNSAAMRIAGLTRDTPDPEGGRIIRDQAGEPTGVLIDNAIDLVSRHMTEPTAEVVERRILAAADKAAAEGLTCVHEMGIGDATAEVYRKLARDNRLAVRVYAFLAADMKVLEGLGARKVEVDDGAALFALRGVKFYSDGALGSRGAALLAPYSDDPGNSGLLVHPAEDIDRAALLAAEHGWQMGTHAIGDAANRAVLDAYEKALQKFPDRDLRFRVEHAQVLAPEDLPRFGKLGVLAAMQPTHATSDMPWAEARLGPERVRGAYAWRTVLEGGGRIVGGSDFPVEEVSPLLGIHAAVTRQDRHGSPAGGWYPEQRLTLEEAVRIFTVEPAYAAFVETSRGKLAEGYLADITVYDRVLKAGASLLDTRIDMTVVGGRVTYERAE
jgi:predicted amidohydrolase YtcJ